MRHNLLDISSSNHAELIPLINSLSSYDLFSEEKTHLQTVPLPFFKEYRLLSAQTFSTIPPVNMHDLWNEKNNDIVKMDGTRDAVFDTIVIYGTEIYHSIIALRQDGIFDFQSETELKTGMSCVRVIFLE